MGSGFTVVLVAAFLLAPVVFPHAQTQPVSQAPTAPWPTQPAPLPPGQTNDPFPAPIPALDGVVRVSVAEFATLPDLDGVAARMMNLVNESGTVFLLNKDDGTIRRLVP